MTKQINSEQINKISHLGVLGHFLLIDNYLIPIDFRCQGYITDLFILNFKTTGQKGKTGTLSYHMYGG